MNLRLVAIILSILAAAAVVLYVQKATKDEVLRDIREKQDTAVGKATDSRGNFDSCPDGMWDYGADRCRGSTKNIR